MAFRGILSFLNGRIMGGHGLLGDVVLGDVVGDVVENLHFSPSSLAMLIVFHTRQTIFVFSRQNTKGCPTEIASPESRVLALDPE